MPTDINQVIRSFGLKRQGNDIAYGIGCAWLGRRELNDESVRKDAAVLKLAYESGFRYFDTSEAYGESEVIVGEFMKDVPRGSVFVATKSRVPIRVTPHTAGQYVKVRLEASLQRMNVDSVDLFQIHDIGELAPVLASGGVLDVLLEAKEQGKIRYIGMATRNLELLGEAVRHGGFDTVLTYSDYTPLGTAAQPLIEAAQRHHVGIVNGSPLCAGFLTDHDEIYMPPPFDPELIHRRELAVEFSAICRIHGISVLQAALHFSLLQPLIGITLTGPASQEELRLTLAALEQGLSDEQWGLLSDWWRKAGFYPPGKWKHE